MEFLYLGCLVISILMLVGLKVFDVRNSTIQFINLLIIIISNLGFYFIATAPSVEVALFAQIIAYVGGIFLPIFYFLMVLEICHVELPRFLVVALVLIQCALFGLVCTIGRSEIFYKSASIYQKNGTTFMVREYGPLHVIYPITMYLYLLGAFAVAIYALVKNKSVNRRSVLAMLIFSTLAVTTYVIEKAAHLEVELIPIAFVVLMLGALIPVYDSNLYTVYENKDIINEQLGRVGFLTFNKRKVYKGCNDYMRDVFPELAKFRIGEKIGGCSDSLQALIEQIAPLEEMYKEDAHQKHVHREIEPFWLGDKCYEGMIHVVTDAFGSLKGFTIELRDDTADRLIIDLKERYNEELKQDVDEKTRRIRFIQQKTILGMAQMVESRDLSTGGHIKRTSEVVRIFSDKLLQSDLGFDRHFLRLVIRSAPMHDLGKIGVDDAILRKRGRFTEDEYAQMKTHSEIGYRMVTEILSEVEEPDFLRVAQNVAHYHHEKMDGSGYPHGLKGDEIPVEARIMALADVFDALVSKRCYKDAFSYDKAFEIIKQDSGTHFDAKLAEVFISCRPELEEYYNNSAN